MKKQILIALSVLICVPHVYANQTTTFDTLMQQIKNHDVRAFKANYNHTQLNSAQQISLLERAHGEKAILQKKIRQLSPNTWSDIKTVGWGSLLLCCSVIIASPVILSGLDAGGVLKKFLNPDHKIVQAGWDAWFLSQTINGQESSHWNIVQILFLSLSTLNNLFPNHKELTTLKVACLYTLCIGGSIAAGVEGGKTLKRVLFDARNTAQKMKNIDEIIKTLTKHSRVAQAYHTIQGIA